MKLVQGHGINDLPKGTVTYKENGKRRLHPFYSAWKNMLDRCYNPKFHDRYPTYIGCSVSVEWLTLSNFKQWFDSNYVDGYQLDKDFVFTGNKVYSPTTCNFIPQSINLFIIDSAATKGDYLIGVSLHKPNNKLLSRVTNPFTKKQEHLGCFHNTKQGELEAHNTWKARKHHHAIQLAEHYNHLPESILQRLRTLYL